MAFGWLGLVFLFDVQGPMTLVITLGVIRLRLGWALFQLAMAPDGTSLRDQIADQ